MLWCETISSSPWSPSPLPLFLKAIFWPFSACFGAPFVTNHHRWSYFVPFVYTHRYRKIHSFWCENLECVFHHLNERKKNVRFRIFVCRFSFMFSLTTIKNEHTTFFFHLPQYQLYSTSLTFFWQFLTCSEFLSGYKKKALRRDFVCAVINKMKYHHPPLHFFTLSASSLTNFDHF